MKYQIIIGIVIVGLIVLGWLMHYLLFRDRMKMYEEMRVK